MDFNQDGKKDLLVGDSTGYLFIFLNEGADAEPVLAARKNIKVAGKIFGPELLKETFPDIKYCYDRVKPDVADFNSDGKKDIIVGVEGGYVLLLLNTGADNAPAFNKITLLMIGAEPLRPNTRLMRVDPKVYDWNNDGKKDLLLADEFGNIHFYPNIGADAAPKFRDHTLLHAQGSPVKPPSNNSVRTDLNGDQKEDRLYATRYGFVDTYLQDLHDSITPRPLKIAGQNFKSETGQINLASSDWNNDGKPDLLLGLTNGRVLLLVNPGITNKVDFPEAIELKDGDQILNGGPGVVPEVIDFNKDGKKDLKCTDASNNVNIFINQGDDAEPVFNGSQRFEVKSSPIQGGFRSRLDIADWNNDGHDDLIYGVVDDSDSKGRLYVFFARPPEK